VYGRLTVLAKTNKTNTCGRFFYLCICSCGVEKSVQINSLHNGLTRSCGCLRSETTAHKNVLSATHGLRNSVEYRIWTSMLSRCRNPKYENYPHYGGRGISVCKRWAKFENFYADLGPRPLGAFQLDRKDNDGNYTPKNCRWATPKQNSRNKRNTLMTTYQGTVMPLIAAAELCGVKYPTLQYRVKRGWSADRLFMEATK
jgi:hypothetical protein